jgi:hypothetical protein
MGRDLRHRTPTAIKVKRQFQICLSRTRKAGIVA